MSNIKKTEVDMTVGKPSSLLIKFAIPIIISQTFQLLYSTVDSIIVGKFVGKEALAAVSSSGSLIMLFTSLFIGTAMGAGVIISKYFGEKNYEDMSKAIHTNVAFGLCSGIILTILGVFLTPYILKLMQTPENILPLSILYFRYFFFGVTAIVMYNIFNGILQALGNTKRPLMYLIIASLTNIVLDLLFVAVFKMSVMGAALATMLSQFISAFLCFLFLIKRGTIYQIKISNIRFHPHMLSKILKYGLPAGIQNSVIALANVFVQSNINTFGDNAVAGCGIYNKIDGFAFIPINGFTMAIATFVGQNLGAKEYDRARQGSRFGIITSMLLAECVGVLLFLLAPILAKIFSDDPDVIAVSTKQFHTISLFSCLLAFSHCIAAVCRGAGKAFIPMIIMISIWCVFRVIYILIAMSISHNIRLVFIAYPLTWFISSIIYIIYYLKSDWIHGYE